MIPTKLKVFNTQFDWNVFRNLLARVAERATELNDPIMNVLMLRLNLYEVPNGERHKIIEQIKEDIENGNQETTINQLGEGD